ncbi:MAG: DUF2089 domain-containing protein [Anaerolineae bacterium]|nr:DUF2089 domain-containing protein [Anaerolineae bacterium]
MRKILEQCPACGGPLVVTEVVCQRCQTQVRGHYSPCPFCALTSDQLVFLKLFVEKRGNLREMERELGVSYPTVRGKLEEVAERLGAAPVPAEGPAQPAPSGLAAEERQRILRLVAEGKLSPKEALARLRGE